MAADHNGFSIQKKPGAVHAGVVQGGEVKGGAVLCALRTSSRINEYLAQREWTLCRAKNAGRGAHWLLLRTDLSNPVLCIAASRPKRPVTMTKGAKIVECYIAHFHLVHFEVLGGINQLRVCESRGLFNKSRLLPIRPSLVAQRSRPNHRQGSAWDGLASFGCTHLTACRHDWLELPKHIAWNGTQPVI